MIIMSTRICKNCNIEKSLEAYNKHPRMLEGRFSVCKVCKNTRQREYHKNYQYENGARLYQCRKADESAREKYSDTYMAVYLRENYKKKSLNPIG